jgi:DNA-binding transcriptional ArsR family regulator
MSITKALADENRVRTILFLRHGELCVCRIIDMLELAPSTVSKHMAILQQAGLVESRKEGRWRNYSLAGRSASAPARAALRWVVRACAGEPRTAADDKRLKKVMKKDIQELCARYKG